MPTIGDKLLEEFRLRLIATNREAERVRVQQIKIEDYLRYEFAGLATQASIDFDASRNGFVLNLAFRLHANKDHSTVISDEFSFEMHATPMSDNELHLEYPGGSSFVAKMNQLDAFGEEIRKIISARIKTTHCCKLDHDEEAMRAIVG